MDAEPVDIHDQRHLDRLNAFSDGVFAIAITLLVLSIEVPPETSESLGEALRELGPNLSAYFIGFALVGLYWYGHSNMFSYLRRTSGRLTLVNLALLSMISLMPFTTSVLGRFGDEPLATAIYAANLGLAAVFDSILDRVAIKDDLYFKGAAPDLRAVTIGGAVRASFFALSIPLAFVSPEAAQISWFLVFLTRPITNRFVGDARRRIN